MVLISPTHLVYDCSLLYVTWKLLYCVMYIFNAVILRIE